MIHSPENTMFFFWLGLTDQRSWKPKGSKSSAICRCFSGPLAEENLGISSHHGFHILVTLMMVLVNGTIGVTIYTVRGTQMVWWLGLDDSGSPMESPMKTIPLNKWHLSFGPIPVSRVAVKPGENCLPTSYLCGVSLFCCLSNVCPFNSVCFQCCLCSPFRDKMC